LVKGGSIRIERGLRDEGVGLVVEVGGASVNGIEQAGVGVGVAMTVAPMALLLLVVVVSLLPLAAGGLFISKEKFCFEFGSAPSMSAACGDWVMSTPVPAALLA
jgi:hypothetical protein